MRRYFKLICDTKHILKWKSKRLPNESIKSITASDNSLAPLTSYKGYKIKLKFNGSILGQAKVMYYVYHKKVVNIYIVYESAGSSSQSDDATLKTCLFGTVTLTKNEEIDKYGYSGYGIGYDRKSRFSFPGGEFGQNALIFGADTSSSAYISKKKTY